MVRYFLVGALTWRVPRGTDKLKGLSHGIANEVKEGEGGGCHCGGVRFEAEVRCQKGVMLGGSIQIKAMNLQGSSNVGHCKRDLPDKDPWRRPKWKWSR